MAIQKNLLIAKTEGGELFSWIFKEEKRFKIMVPHFLGVNREVDALYLDDEMNMYVFNQRLQEIQIYSIL